MGRDEVVKAKIHTDGRCGEVAVLGAIADVCNEQGYCYASYARLQRETKLSRSAIREAIVRLEKRGELRRVPGRVVHERRLEPQLFPSERPSSQTIERKPNWFVLRLGRPVEVFEELVTLVDREVGAGRLTPDSMLLTFGTPSGGNRRTLWRT